MKKLLSILTSVAITAVGATTVVACSVPKTSIDVTFKGDGISYDDKKKEYTIGGATYTPEQLDQAMNGNFSAMNTQLPVAMSFDQLNQSLINLISFNQSLVVKTQKNQAQLKSFRDTFLGRDQNVVNEDKGIDTPSVDGIKFNKIDDNNYYGGFQRTHISSLTGLLDLYNYVNDKNNNLKVLGASANADIDLANKLFKDENSPASQLMKEFANSKKNPAFTKIEYDMPLSVYNSQSQIISGFQTDKDANNSNLTLSDNATYLENNTDVEEEKTVSTGGKKGTTENATARITDHVNSNPYGAIVIKPADGDMTIKTTNDTFKQANSSDRDAADSVLREFFEKNNKNGNGVYYYSNADGDNQTFSQNIGEYVVKKVEPIKVSYTYETNMDKSKTETKSDSEQYKINLTLNNVAEIFSPYMTAVNATNLSSITKKDNKLVLKFNKNVTDKDFANLTGVTNAKVQSDGTVIADYEASGTIKFNPKANTKDDTRVSKEPLTYNFDFSDGKKTTINYTTSQLSWVFRGYKFLNDDNLTDEEQNGQVWVESQVEKKKKTGAPIREGDLKADIEHNLRDMLIEDVTITKTSK